MVAYSSQMDAYGFEVTEKYEDLHKDSFNIVASHQH